MMLSKFAKPIQQQSPKWVSHPPSHPPTHPPPSKKQKKKTLKMLIPHFKLKYLAPDKFLYDVKIG